MSGNLFICRGRLTKDPEIRYFDSGSVVANFAIAVDEYRKDDKTLFLDMEAWGKTAEFMGTHMKKGAYIAVQGSLDKRERTTKDGQTFKQLTIKAYKVDPIIWPPKDGESNSGGQQSSYSDSAAPASHEPQDEFIPF